MMRTPPALGLAAAAFWIAVGYGAAKAGAPTYVVAVTAIPAVLGLVLAVIGVARR